MSYKHIKIPEGGRLITADDGRLVVSDNPILGFIEGDGIGPDITRACMRIWDAAVEQAYGGRRKVHWMEIYMGEKASEKYDGSFFPEESRAALQQVMVSIKGPLTTPVGGGIRSLNVALRQDLDLYACVRPVRYYQGVPSPLREPELVDVVIFRENTEDVYAGIEFQAGTPEAGKVERFLKEEMGAEFFENSGIGVKPISAFCSKRLIRKAIQYALAHGRESVTLVHKGNIQKYTEGAFRNWGYELAREEFGEHTVTEAELYSTYGGKRPAGRVVIKDRIADIMFQLMLLRPNEFDVIATTNLNGDYLSDAIAAEVGGVGIAPGANMADHVAVFEATHGTAPKYANLDKVNPGSLLFSGVMMFEYLGWKEVADLITFAYPEVIQQKFVTYDFARLMPGATEVSTSRFAEVLIEQMQADQDLDIKREEWRRAVERERQEREARRVAQPFAEMQASGRIPTTVADIMSPVRTISPGVHVMEVMHLMREHGISSVVVEPGKDGLWAIMTQRDIISRIIHLNRSPARVKVEEIASKPLVTVPIEMSLQECAARMVESSIRRVVVEQNDTPVGIVSDTDLFRIVDEFGWGPVVF